MARRVVLAGMVTALAVIVAACGPGVTDYAYDVAGQYELFRCSRDVIFICCARPPQPKADTKIPTKVVEVAWDERYVLVKQQHVDGDGDPVRRAYNWWVLDTREHVRHGPLTEPDFAELRGRLGIDPGLELRSPTAFIPPGR